MRTHTITFAATSVAGAAMMALAGPVAAQVYTNESGGKVEFYGQFSPTLQYFDDGKGDDTNLADNAHSGSRLGFTLDQPFDSWNFRFNAEISLNAPATDGFTQDDDPEWDWSREDIRKFEAIFSGDFGTFSFGQGSMATDGAAEADLSMTSMVGYSGSGGDSAGSYLFMDRHTGNQSGVALGDVFGNMDGGRQMRVRYDTPEFHGFSGAVAYGYNALDDDDDDDYYDVALHYGNDFGDFTLDSSVGYAWRDPDEGDTRGNWAGSVSVLHNPTGLNGAVAGGSGEDDGSYYYLKAGWNAEIFKVGVTAFSVDYYNGDDFVSDDSSSDHWGLQATQYFDKYNIEAYFGYRQYSYDDDNDVAYLDASSILAGVRWKF